MSGVWLSFTLSAFLLLAAPGPTNTLLALAAAKNGFCRSIRLILPEIVAYALSILTLRLLLGPVAETNALFGAGLKLIAALWLVHAAARLWFSPAAKHARPVASGRAVFMTTLLNPKALVFAFSLIPAGTGMLYPCLALAIGQIALTGIIWIGIGALILTALASHDGQILNRSGAMVLLAFSAMLLVSSGAALYQA